ncbi:MAG: hypothetical protein RLZZ397_149 [Pseudomonadota bacterium]|jgi:type II secretory pathway component PulF
MMWNTHWKAYLWQAQHPTRTRRQGICWGQDERSVRLSLQIEGYRHITLRSAFQLPMRRWNPALEQRWYEQVATLLSKTSLLQTLRLMPHLSENAIMGKVSMQLLSRIESGMPLWKAMNDLHPHFQKADVAMVRSAEETASLDRTLQRIAQEQMHKLSYRREIQTALAYPLFLLTMALGSLWAMSVWVIPSFLKQFMQPSFALPALTQWVLAVGDLIGMALPSLVLLGISVALTHHVMRNHPLWRRWQTWWFKSQPSFWWNTTSAQARWCSTLATALDSGLSLSTSLHMAAQVQPHPQWQQRANQITHDVSQGMRLALAVERSSLFSPLVWHMADWWESSGGDPDWLQQAADELQRRNRRRWKLIAKWSEPMLIVVTGLIMGIMVLAMYLPMFQLGNQF